jgi:hypothetical protein
MKSNFEIMLLNLLDYVGKWLEILMRIMALTHISTKRGKLATCKLGSRINFWISFFSIIFNKIHIKNNCKDLSSKTKNLLPKFNTTLNNYINCC